MATFEEKILAYLDGSLPADGREDVLAGISGSGARATEQRELFDAHLRLADLMTLVQKPVSAPLALQRDLASKVPVLALKLPYLAAERKRRNAAIFGWFSSMRSSSINAILFIALALIAGGVWFVSSKTNSISSGNAASTANISSPASTSSPTNVSSSGNATSSGANTPNSNIQNGNSSSQNSHLSISNNTSNHISHANTNSIRSGNTNSVDRTLVRSNRNESQLNNGMDRSVIHNGRSVRSAARISNAENSIIQNSSSNVIQDRENVQDNSVAKPAEQISPKEIAPNDPERQIMLSPKIGQSSPAEMIGSGTTIHSLSALTEHEENNDPIRVFAVEEYRYLSVNPQAPLSDYTRKNGIQSNALSFGSPEIGIDYYINPWIAIGLRGGDARFVQEQSVTTQNNGYLYLSRDVRETILLDPFAVWLGPAITYSLSASEDASFTGTFAFANAFVNALAASISPIVRGEVAFLYDLSNTFGLRFAASYEADFMPSATPISAISPNSTSGVVIGSNAAMHESQVLGFSLGFSFHP